MANSQEDEEESAAKRQGTLLSNDHQEDCKAIAAPPAEADDGGEPPDPCWHKRDNDHNEVEQIPLPVVSLHEAGWSVGRRQPGAYTPPLVGWTCALCVE